MTQHSSNTRTPSTRWPRKIGRWAATGLLAISNVVETPAVAVDLDANLVADVGRQLPVSRSNTLPLKYRDRYLLIQRDESVNGNTPGATETYFMEPPMFFVPATNGVTGLPAWIQAVDQEADGTAKIQVTIVLKDSNLLDAAAALVRARDIDYLHRRAQQRNAGKPLQVQVEPMPVQKIRVELIDLSGRGDVLAFGEADVSRTPEQKEVWLHMEPSTLQQIQDLAKKGRLGIRPFYSYSNMALAKASLLNFGEGVVRDQLAAWLKHRNLTGDGDISQQDIDDFHRQVRIIIGSKIIAETPEAAGFLINNINTLTNLVFEPATQAPFVRGGSQADDQKLAEHLGPLGWSKSRGDAWESELEESRTRGSSTGINTGVSGGVGNDKMKAAVQFGFSSTSDQVDATLRRTGILMTKNEMTQGWMPTKIQKYRVKKHAVDSGVSYSAEVSIGIGAVRGLFNGESFRVEQMDGAGVAAWSVGYMEEMMKVERDREPLHASFAASKLGHAAVARMTSEMKHLQDLVTKVDDLKDASDSMNDKAKVVSRLEGKIGGIRESLGLLAGHHHGIDEEEAGDMRGRGAGKVGEMVLPLERQRDDVNAEVRKLRNVTETLRREILDAIEERQDLLEAVCESLEDDEASKLAARIRSLMPAKPTYDQKKVIDSLERLIQQREASRTALLAVLREIKKQELDLLNSDEQAPGALVQEIESILALFGLDLEVAHCEGKHEGMHEFGSWYIGTTAATHDAGDSNKISGWWDATQLRNVTAQVNNAKASLASRKPEERLAKYKSQRNATRLSVAGIKKNVTQLQRVSRDLAAIETELEQSVARLQVTLANN